MKLTKKQRIENALDKVKTHQDTFWDAVNDLERLTNTSLRTDMDFSAADVESILREEFDEE